jgi:uncharacterized protein YdhG (YjbR/CyaY superfamily)
VDQYIAVQPAPVQRLLERVRASIRQGMPGAEEAISYQIPAYRLNGRAVIYFAAWKKHFSLYPATGGLVAAFEADLAPYDVEKGTIRFPLTGTFPAKLIERIARFRAQEAAAPKQPGARAPGKAKAGLARKARAPAHRKHPR